MTALAVATALAILPDIAVADNIKPIFYAQMVAAHAKLADFKYLFPERDRPVTGLLHLPDFDIGKSFLGQQIEIRNYSGEFFDALTGSPATPITLNPDASKNTLFWDRLDPHFQAPLIAAYGPKGGASKDVIGEGSLAFLFDKGICEFGFKTLPESSLRSFGPNLPKGPLKITFYDEAAKPLGVAFFGNANLSSYAFAVNSQSAVLIKAITLENIDPEGIGISNLLYLETCSPDVS